MTHTHTHVRTHMLGAFRICQTRCRPTACASDARDAHFARLCKTVRADVKCACCVQGVVMVSAVEWLQHM